MNARSVAMDFFQGRGWTKAQSAGIVGNLMGESNLDPHAVGDQGEARGIGQWHSDRWARLQQFSLQTGKPATDLMTQLAFVDHELSTTEGAAAKRLRSATNVEQATAAAIGFERPQGWTAANPRAGHNFTGRLDFAQGAFGGGGDGSVSDATAPEDQGPLLTQDNPYQDTDLNADQPLTAQQVVAQANSPAGPDTPYESVFATAKAAASTDWYTSWGISRMSEGSVDPNWKGPTHDEWEQTMKDIPDDYHNYLLGAGSQQAFETRVKNAQQDMETQSRLANTPGSTAIRFLTDLFDPVTLPVNLVSGGAGAEIATGGRLLRAASGALSAGVSNMALDATAKEATGDPNTNPLMAFGMGAILGGTLGGLARNPHTAYEAKQLRDLGHRSVKDAMGVPAEEGINPDIPFIPGGKGNAGAASSGKSPSDWLLDDHHVAEGAYGKVRFDAVGQLTTSKEPRTRLMGWLLGEDPVGTKDHGVVEDPITVRQAALARRRMAMIEKTVQVDRAKYVSDNASNHWNPIDRARTTDDFHHKVMDAIWATTPDADTSPHVTHAADAYRKFYAEYQKDIQNPRRESGGYADPLGDVRSNPNYAPLYANHAKIAEIGNTVDEKVMENFLLRAIQNHSPEIDVKLGQRMARGYWRNIRRAGYGIEEHTEMALSHGDREMFKSAYRELDNEVDDETLDNLFDTLGGVAKEKTDENANKPARLKRRTLMDYDFKATLDGYGELRPRDLFNKDIEFATRRYNRTMSARIAAAQTVVRNPTTGEVFLDGIRNEADFNKLKNWVREGWSEKYSGQFQKDRDQLERSMANMDFMWQAIHGRPLYGSDQKFAQWVRRIKTFQFIRLMNNMGLNQVQETWKMVSTLGFKASVHQLPAIRRMVDEGGRSVPLRDQMLNELEDINGFGLDGLFGHYDFRVAEDRLGAIEAGRGTSRLDATLDWGQKLTADLSLMKGIHTYQTRWAVKAISQRLYDIAKKTARTDDKGKVSFDLSSLKGMEKERLAAAGLGDEEAKLVLGNLLKHGSVEGYRLTGINASKWDPQAVTKFSYLTTRMVDRIVQANSTGQLHRWMSAPAAQLFTQFRHFVFGAWGKSTLYAMHHFDPQTFVLLMGELMAGVATYALRQSTQLATADGADHFWEKTMDPVNLLKNGFARTATSSILPMLMDTGLMFTPAGPQFGSARASGQAADAFMGSPAISSLDDIRKFTSGAIDSVVNDREMSQTELRSGMKSLPFGNWLPLLGVFESMIQDRDQFPEKN